MDDFQTLFTFLVGLLVALLAITALVAAVYILTGVLNSTRRAERAAQTELSRALAALPPGEREAFVSYANAGRKSPTVAVLLALFLGWLGTHRFYLRDYGIGFIYLAWFLLGIPVTILMTYLYFNPQALPDFLPLGWALGLLLLGWLGLPATVALLEAFWMPRRAHERNLEMLRRAEMAFRDVDGGTAVAPAAPLAPQSV